MASTLSLNFLESEPFAFDIRSVCETRRDKGHVLVLHDQERLNVRMSLEKVEGFITQHPKCCRKRVPSRSVVINHRHICKCVFCGLASTTAHDVAVALALDVDMTFLVAARRDNVASLELEVTNVVVLIFSRRYGREPLVAIGGLADKRGIPAQDHHGSMRTIVFDLFGEDLIRPKSTLCPCPMRARQTDCDSFEKSISTFRQSTFALALASVDEDGTVVAPKPTDHCAVTVPIVGSNAPFVS